MLTLPMERPEGRPFDPPTELSDLRERQPVAPLRFPDGHVGWLATSHAAVRAVLSDPRFSARQEILHVPTPSEAAMITMPPAEPGNFLAMDAPEHTRYRRLLVGKFTVRRMRLLTDRITEITVGCLDAMERGGSRADLVPAFAEPIPALTICELLGVPSEDRVTFQTWSATLSRHDATIEEMGEAYGSLGTFLYELVLAKRACPTDDLLSDIVAAGDLADEELAGVGVLLLGAGLDTTANMLALGTFALLTHPEQLAVLRAEPELVPAAVEELLRYLTITHIGARTALEDVEVEGQLVEAGQTVALALQAANRDPKKFPDPDTLDLRRDASGQLGFGHGIHQCLGQQLARVEMQAAFPALLARFPGLRLDVAPAEVPMRHGMDIYGVHSLPVAW